MRSKPTTRVVLTVCASIAVAILLAWPAWLNRYPLLFPDTLGYLAAGRPALHALFHGPPFGGMRSPLYALAILPFHLNRTPWPILLFHAAPVVYTVYLTTRTLTPSHAFTKTLVLLAILGAFTSLSWYISLLMPDILGAPLYLALFLLTFARPQLSHTEQLLLALIVILGATAHTTHLLLALALLPLLYVLNRSPRTAASAALPAFAVLLTAIALQLATNARLYGHASLDGNRPPYLEARLLADGPATQYLREHCPDPALPDLCSHLDNLPANDDAFLWDDHGIWSQATPPQKLELLHEELPLARATLRTYPRAQLAISTRNFADQLTSFGLDDFDNNDYMQSQLDTVFPNARAAYDRSRQATNSMPWWLISHIQDLLVLGSVVLIGIFFQRSSPRLRALIQLTAFILVGNAALTGIFSEVDARYQARILWLLPLAAMLALLERRDRSHSASS